MARKRLKISFLHLNCFVRGLGLGLGLVRRVNVDEDEKQDVIQLLTVSSLGDEAIKHPLQAFSFNFKIVAMRPSTVAFLKFSILHSFGSFHPFDLNCLLESWIRCPFNPASNSKLLHQWNTVSIEVDVTLNWTFADSHEMQFIGIMTSTFACGAASANWDCSRNVATGTPSRALYNLRQ